MNRFSCCQPRFMTLILCDDGVRDPQATTSQLLTDLAATPTFNDTRVALELSGGSNWLVRQAAVGLKERSVPPETRAFIMAIGGITPGHGRLVHVDQPGTRPASAPCP